MRRLPFALVLLSMAGVAPSVAFAQERDCTYRMVDLHGRAEGTTTAEGDFIFMRDPFVVTCVDGTELRANSGNINQTTRVVYLLGDVYFQDGSRTLTAREATYNANTAWLWARGEVVFVDQLEGSTLRGPDLEYYRATAERPQAEMSATQRPILTLAPRGDEPGGEPLDLVADRIHMIGEDDLSAFGAVVITRTDLRATGGEARYNAATEQLEIRENAVIRSEERELSGEVVRARLASGALEYLHATTDAALQSEDLRVTAEDLQLFFENELLERLIARSPPGEGIPSSRAASSTFRIEADSLTAMFTDQRLEEVHAVGNARGESLDTTAVALDLPLPPAAEPIDEALQEGGDEEVPSPAPPIDDFRNDWIVGDTIIGYFASVPRDEVEPADAVAEAEGGPESSIQLRRLVAIGTAQSFYRLRSENDPGGPKRNMNFLVGDRIELELADGDLDVAHVEGLQYGLYLEADAPASPPAPDVQPGEPAADVQNEIGGA